MSQLVYELIAAMYNKHSSITFANAVVFAGSSLRISYDVKLISTTENFVLSGASCKVSNKISNSLMSIPSRHFPSRSD